jgi:hypothetical protein
MLSFINKFNFSAFLGNSLCAIAPHHLPIFSQQYHPSVNGQPTTVNRQKTTINYLPSTIYPMPHRQKYPLLLTLIE